MKQRLIGLGWVAVTLFAVWAVAGAVDNLLH